MLTVADAEMDQSKHAVAEGARVRELDGVRGVAILLVMVHHFALSARALGFDSKLLTLGQLGWCGVDLFFVLSGFLITGILYDSKGSGGYFRNFYARRILRIFPLYYMALAVVILLSSIWPKAGVWPTSSPLWVATFLTNFVIAFLGPAATGALTHYWSLAIEEHFYLIWPLLVFVLNARQLIVVGCAIVLLAFALRIALLAYGANLDAIFVLTPTRIDTLALGAILAVLSRQPRGMLALVPVAWLAVGIGLPALGLIVLVRHTVDETDPMIIAFGYSLLALLAGALIVLGTTLTPLKRVLRRTSLVWFGKYSFGLYVWHPIIGLLLLRSEFGRTLNLATGTNAALVFIAAFALDLATAWISFHVWEKRFLSLKKNFAG
jgi:peptidoglycan/LPS O-acetylase OafA/YrhL